MIHRDFMASTTISTEMPVEIEFKKKNCIYIINKSSPICTLIN